MSDLISREALLDSLYSCEELKGRKTTEAVAKTIMEQPTVEAEPQWIPCSERLPEEDKMSEYYEAVNVTLDNGRVVNGCYRNADEEWWVDAECGEKYSINVTGHVIAWMPLPKAYKAEQT